MHGISEGASNNPDPFGGNNVLFVDPPEEEEVGHQQPVGPHDDLGDSNWGRKQIKEAQEKLEEEHQLKGWDRAAGGLAGVGKARMEQQRIIIKVLRLIKGEGLVRDAETVVRGVEDYTSEYVYGSPDVSTLKRILKDLSSQGTEGAIFEDILDTIDGISRR